MKRHNPHAGLFDALQATDRVARFLEARSREAFLADDQVQFAVYYQLIVIGNAMNRATRDDPGIAASAPGLSAITGLHDSLVRDYHDIDGEVILAVLTERLPESRRQVEQLLVSYD